MENMHQIFAGLHGDLTEFVDRISSVLGCPVTLEDAHHQLLAYSIHDDLSDPVRISTIVTRRVPEKIINSLWKEGFMPALLQGNEPVIVPSLNDVEFGTRAAVSIKKNEEVLGFIWALQTRDTFTEEHLAFLKLAAREGKNQLLQAHLKKKRYLENHQEFLWQLLTGHFQSESKIAQSCLNLSLVLPTPYAVVVFHFPDDITQATEKSISYMLSTTQKIKAALYTLDRKRLIILIGAAVPDNFSKALTEFIQAFILQMKTRFEIDSIQGACGHIYETYIKARSSYDEALYTLSLQQAFPDSKHHLINYGTLGLYQYMKTLSNHPINNSAWQSLINYDQKNQTQLAATLEAYLKHDGNLYDVAEHLHVHVNTIHYRVKRISEIAQVNLKDPLIKTALLLELLIQQYKAFSSVD
ncbi:helix-turn-helix domain-containing protein [Bacillus sp. AGMB 02131]|uniref:Helix-turn-helix domain-containing protein n=1 Tax=Peribacillus faecalis TaxID=2772559 RepID=A0A927HA33_9BACI|nr:helix-turn-helix domain-containing protein [Peribacillus faecalis]MBD3107122.1 helix-turn-helix domain-containing protein [Peribacillus faecalis]